MNSVRPYGVWLGALVASFAWALLSHGYGNQGQLWGILLLAAGCLVITGVARSPRIPLDQPPPASVSRVRRAALALRWAPGFALSAFLVLLVILPIQAVFWAIFRHLEPRTQFFDLLAYPVCLAMKVLGHDCAVSGGTTYLESPSALLPVVVSAGKIGLLPVVCFALGGIVLILTASTGKRLRNSAVFVCVLCLYAFLRFIIVLSVYGDIPNVGKDHSIPPPMRIFWDPWFLLATFLPLVLILGKFLPVDLRGAFEVGKERIGRLRAVPLRVAAVFLASAFFIVTGITFHDPGKVKQGRILIDGSHSDYWEQVSKKFDKNWYGDLAAYSYSNAVSLLTSYYVVGIHEKGELSEEILSKYDIAVIKTPTKPLSVSEITALESFVREGGGLFVLSDHNDLMGMTTNSNELVSRFGLRFRPDALSGLSSGGYTLFAEGPLGRHPAALSVQKPFEFMTSCSIEGPWSSENVALTDDCYSDWKDVANPSNFGEFRPDLNSRFGTLMVGTARKCGKGRIVAWGDETVFSTFALFRHKHYLALLSIMNYLNRENVWGYALNWVFLGVGVAGLLAALVGFRSLGLKTLYAIGLPAAAAGVVLGLIVVSEVNSRNYRLPRPMVSRQRVAFIGAKCEAGFPGAVGAPGIPLKRAFDTPFVTVQRLGCMPAIEDSIEAACKEADILFLINPVRMLEPKEYERIWRFVKEGGKLLIADCTGLGNISASNAILQPYEMAIEGMPVGKIVGGQTFELPDKNFRCAWKDEGWGRVVVIIDSCRFSREVMGHCYSEPTEESRPVYESLYALFEELILGGRKEPQEKSKETPENKDGGR